MCAGSLNLSEIVVARREVLPTGSVFRGSLPQLVLAAALSDVRRFFVSALAETNRPPFDLVEAESELVAGFMVEYSSTPYLLFMLGEYVAMILMCALTTILFLGGWLSPSTPALTWIPGVVWFLVKAVFRLFHVRHGESDRAALPL